MKHKLDWFLFLGAIAAITISALVGIIKPVPSNYDVVKSQQKIEQASQANSN